MSEETTKAGFCTPCDAKHAKREALCLSILFGYCLDCGTAIGDARTPRVEYQVRRVTKAYVAAAPPAVAAAPPAEDHRTA